jgi:CheY-like chemotaxis protein
MLNILLIDDSEDDTFLLQRALDREKVPCFVRNVADGAEAVSYLEGKGRYADRAKSPFPNIIFTDLKMPKMDGFSLLSWLRKNPKCQLLPAMVLSSSAEETDIEKAYRLGANAYLVKPSSMAELQKLVRHAYEFWSACAKVTIKLAS